MSKRGLPVDIRTRHDLHYIEELATPSRSVGKILKLDLIEPNPDQPRTEFGDLTELTSSIKEHGVLEPLLVRPIEGTNKWMIIAGERRWRASNLAGLTEVPCIELDISDQAVAEIALVENLQRKDLTIWEEADGLAKLGTQFGYTHDKISQTIGKSRTTVTEYMSIASIPENVREKCKAAGLTAKTSLLEVARQFDDAAMMAFVDSLGTSGVSREEVRKKARPDSGTKTKTEKVATEVVDDASVTETQIQAKVVLSRFSYNSPENGFKVEIVFDHDGKYDRKEVLQALKEAFDHVKLNRQG